MSSCLMLKSFALALAILASGCTSLGGGKLEPATKKVASAALTAGAIAAPEYTAIINRIKAVVEAQGGVSTTDPLAGYLFTRTYFYDGTPVSDPSRITWVDKWERSTSAGTTTPPVITTNTIVASDDDALAETIANILSGVE